MSNRGVSPVAPVKGPAELVLAASIARRYYVDGLNKIEIAEEFRLSRFKVARLLHDARAWGLVRIEIGYPGEVDVVLSARLQERFGLRHSVVVDTGEASSEDEHEDALRRRLGAAAADLLSEVVTPDDVLGLAWARSVSAMAAALTRLPPVPVVQLTGALFRSPADAAAPEASSIDLVREVARVSGGRAYLFFAPFMVADQPTAQALRRQPDVAQALDHIGSVTKVVAGIGHWAPGQSTLYDAATPAEQRELTEIGVCADIGGVFLRADGSPVDTPLNDRMIGIDATQLAETGEVIGIPYGVAKAPAVLAALRSGLISSLVTHSSLAWVLLGAE